MDIRKERRRLVPAFAPVEDVVRAHPPEVDSNGMPIEQIRIMLGHAKLETTMRYINFDYSDVKSNHAKFVA